MHAATLILGGTFDPVHFGHLRAAAELYEQLQVDDFRMLPAGQPPHRGRTQASASDRLRMLQLALQEHPGIRLDDCEIRRDGPSYMVDTLTQIRAAIGAKRALLLALGQDAANKLNQWHRWQQLPQLAHLVIMTRPDNTPGYSGDLAALLQPRCIERSDQLWSAAAGHVLHLPITELAISSTDIRQQIAAGRDPAFLLPSSVLGYIREHDLYRHE